MKYLKFHPYYIIKLTCTISHLCVLDFIIILYRKESPIIKVQRNFDSGSISLTHSWMRRRSSSLETEKRRENYFGY